MRMFKKGLATVLALLMLVVAVPFGGLAVYADADYPVIELEVTTDAVIKGGHARFQFTPAETGRYAFYSMADEDTYGYILDTDGNRLASDDDGGEGYNFYIVYGMVAGETYILDASYYNASSGNYPVRIERADVVASVEVEPIQIVRHTNGHYRTDDRWNDDGEHIPTPQYFYYSSIAPRAMTVMLIDGTVVEGTEVEWNGYWYGVTYSNPQSYETCWDVGVHTVEATIADFPFTYEVEIVESPIASVEFEPITLIESEGWLNYNESWNEELGEYERYNEYLHYDVYPSATITMKDGTVYKDVYGIDWEGGWYEISIRQDYEHSLQRGVNHATGSLLGYDFTCDVEIIDTPIASIDFEPFTVIEEVRGYWNEDWYWDDETEEEEYRKYFHYYLYPRATITMKDGTVYEDVSDIEWNGRWYELGGSLNQNYENQLKLGTNHMTGTLLGYDFTLEVEVIDTPIASIEFEPITLIEKVNGYRSENWYWDAELEEDVYREYFHYYLYPSATITMKDGTVYEDVSGFEWDGYWYELDDNLNQSYENQLKLGTNYMTGKILGYDFTLEVEVIDTPIASIEFEPITLIEENNGYWRGNWYWDEELEEEIYSEYFHYHFYPRGTVTMKDGTVYEDVRYIEWEDNYCYFESYLNQNYENRLKLGINHVIGNILGYEFTLDVEVIDTPVASIEVEPIRILQYTDGGYRQDEIWGGEYKDIFEGYTPEYFYYNGLYPRDVTITLIDGTVWENDGFEWNGNWYYLNYENPQNYENRWGIGTHTVEGSIAGCDFTYEVEIVDTPIASIVVNPVNVIEDRDGYWTSDNIWNEELGKYEYVEWFYYYSENIRPTATITMKDGTVYTNRTYVDWNGNRYYMDVEDQAYDNALQLGTNTWSGSILGYEFEYEIAVSTLGVNDSFEFMENENGIIITDCYVDSVTVEIPAEINGKPVIGVASLGDAARFIQHLILPDSVVTIGDYVLSNLYYLQSVHFGAGVSNLTAEMLGYCENLQSITISEDNPYFCVANRALHNKALDTFIAYPTANKSNEYVVPATVVNIDVLDAYSIYQSLVVTFPADHTAFVTVDGVTYNKDMTKVISCRKDKTGDYVMPETVEEIAEGAFMNTKLNSVVVSPKVTEIVYRAFASCASLTSVTLPEGLISIEQSAFEQTFALEDINLPEGLQYIGFYSFYKTGVNNLSIPGSVERIENKAFYRSDVTNLTLGEGIREIGEYAFSETKVTALVLPDSLTQLGTYAFEGCRWLSSLHIGSGLTYIAPFTFRNTGLDTVVIPGNVQRIGEYAFASTYMRSLTLSEGVSHIGEYAFARSMSLKEVHFPASLSSVKGTSFSSCDELVSLTVAPGNETYFSNGNCVIGHDGTLVVGCNGSVIPTDGSVTAIDNYAFYDRNGIDSIVLPDSVTHIGLYAFAGMDSLTDVTLNDHIEFMGTGAFAESSVKNLDLGNSLTFVAPYAFRYTDLREVLFPSSVTDIMYNSFEYCYELTSVEIPLSVESIEEEAFYDCYNLTDVYYQGSEADRYAMDIEWGNEYLENATWHYEHTNDAWAPIPDCDHVYSDNCDNECDLCGRRRFAPHGYVDNCDDYCDVCGEYRSAPHDYDNACDGVCNLCGAIRGTEGHIYDNAVDTSCNTCGSVRELKYIFSDSSATVNIENGGERDRFLFTPEYSGYYNFYSDTGSDTYGYVYNVDGGCLWSDDDGGVDNNFRIYFYAEAGVTYELRAGFWSSNGTGTFEVYLALGELVEPDVCEHEYDNACDAECNLCGEYRGVGDHVYSYECDATCNVCGDFREAAHVYDNACDADCYWCGEMREAADHVYDNICDEDCNECGVIREAEHKYDNACDASCNLCGAIRGVADHLYDNACDTGCNVCGATRTVGDHVYGSKYDADCNECGAIREIPAPVVFSVESATARIGDTFDVSIRLDKNSGLTGFRFNVEYDDTKIELIGAVAGSAFASATFGPIQSPFNVLWIDAISPENTANGEIVVLTFRVKEGATLGDSEIRVVPYTNDVLDGDLNVAPFETVSGTVTLTDGTPGDANGDGNVNMQDLGLLMQYLNGWDVTVDTAVLDVNNDGKVNNRDMALIQRYLNGWDITLQ